MDGPRHLILYDGVCGLCNRLNRFVLARDREDRFRFASLQGEAGRAWVRRFGRDPDALTTLYVVTDYEGDAPGLLARSDAALFVLRQLGGAWRAASALRAVPRRLRDRGYDLVARHRYRWFGRDESCPLPDPRVRGKFLDAE